MYDRNVKLLWAWHIQFLNYTEVSQLTQRIIEFAAKAVPRIPVMKEPCLLLQRVQNELAVWEFIHNVAEILTEYFKKVVSILHFYRASALLAIQSCVSVHLYVTLALYQNGTS